MVAAATLHLMMAGTTFAQQKLGGPAAPGSPTTAAPKPNMPSPETMLALVRTHILALDHALRTNNFYVLHALSGPFLQTRMTPEQLSQAFKQLKADRPDLVAAAIATPALSAAPTLMKNGMLWLKGVFPTKPKQIRFEMVFEVVGQEWRLAGLDIAGGASLATEEKTSVVPAARPPK